VVVADPSALPPSDLDALVRRAGTGELAVVVALAPPGAAPDPALLAAAGITTGRPVTAHPVRIGAGPAGAALLARLDDLAEPATPVVPLVSEADGVEVLLSVPLGLEQVAVATWRPATGVGILGIDPLAMVSGDDDSGLRLLHRLSLVAAGANPAGRPLPRVGLLGFGAIGAEHVAGFTGAGFDVVAVCDRSEPRLAAATAAAPGVHTYAKADELLGDDEVELVALSTPPDSHAHWARAALAAGRHVVVEKPLALSAAQADGMLDASADAGLSLAVYQNRRFDRDFLGLQRLVRSGSLGRVFHLEAFVGGFAHPCNYWHSDEAVSGGTAFDWGSHVLDQILALLPGAVEAVRGSSHKLRWHDVTNADQFRIQLRLADGTEAEFIHSDLAAAPKPKWYVLGTEGAAVGAWRTERVVARDPVGLLVEDVLAPADSPAVVWHHHPDGSRTEVALPGVAPGRWHRELADHLRLGEPLTADPLQSRDVVAVLEAAVASAGAGGRAERPTLRSRR
jgi:scyllo-inositol 2-dehydrogenase (NADP+)